MKLSEMDIHLNASCGDICKRGGSQLAGIVLLCMRFTSTN